MKWAFFSWLILSNIISESTSILNTEVYVPINSSDAGIIYAQNYYTYYFAYKNIGNEPLIISHVSGSSGCVCPTYSKEPLMPGNWDTLRVTYSAQYTGRFHKTVTVCWNTKEALGSLNISGEVRTIPFKLFIYDSVHHKNAIFDSIDYRVRKFMGQNCYTITNMDSISHQFSIDKYHGLEYVNSNWIFPSGYTGYFHQNEIVLYSCELRSGKSINLHFIRKEESNHEIELLMDGKYYIRIKIDY